MNSRSVRVSDRSGTYRRYAVVRRDTGSVNVATLKDLFDEHYYADRYGDLKELYGYDREGLWNHYIQHGLEEGRPMSELINVKKYREQYEDLG